MAAVFSIYVVTASHKEREGRFLSTLTGFSGDLTYIITDRVSSHRVLYMSREEPAEVQTAGITYAGLSRQTLKHSGLHVSLFLLRPF